MSQLSLFDARTGTLLNQTTDVTLITELLGYAGVLFRQWPTPVALTAQSSAEHILQAYQPQITQLQQQEGYQTVDVISLHPDHPDKAALRQKFLAEHTHGEDEVRFFVRGQGLFCLHIKGKIYQVLCCQQDLIAVPAGTPHWFDMGSAPDFAAIRLFNNPEGWVANFTGSDIASRFPLLN